MAAIRSFVAIQIDNEDLIRYQEAFVKAVQNSGNTKKAAKDIEDYWRRLYKFKALASDESGYSDLQQLDVETLKSKRVHGSNSSAHINALIDMVLGTSDTGIEIKSTASTPSIYNVQGARLPGADTTQQRKIGQKSLYFSDIISGISRALSDSVFVKDTLAPQYSAIINKYIDTNDEFAVRRAISPIVSQEAKLSRLIGVARRSGDEALALKYTNDAAELRQIIHTLRALQKDPTMKTNTDPEKVTPKQLVSLLLNDELGAAGKVIKNKAKNLQATFGLKFGSTTRYYATFVSGVQFTPEDISASITRDKEGKPTLFYYFTTKFENQLLQKLNEQIQSQGQQYIERLAKSTEKDFRGITSILSLNDVIAQLGIEHTNSIPIGAIKLTGRKNKSTSPKKRLMAIPIFDDDETKVRSQFISKEVMSDELRKLIKQQMPVGPIGGKPLSSNVLTYRTGRFLQSVSIKYLNYADGIARYGYDPRYMSHESTARDPRKLIGGSLRALIAHRYKRQFNISRL